MYSKLMEEIKNVKAGTIVRVEYDSQVPVKAASKKNGVEVRKITETSCRIGVKYSNIESVKQRKLEEAMLDTPKKAYTNPYEWIIEDRIAYHPEKEKYYLQIASLNEGHNTQSKYIVCVEGKEIEMSKNELLESEYKDHITNSYFNKPSGTAPEVRKIAFENIRKFKDYVREEK